MPPSRRENRNLAQLVTGLLAILTVSSQNCRACLFHDDGIRELSITCPGYGVTLLRSNGALTGITAKGNLVSRGSLDGCLFGMVTPNNTYCGACSCADNGDHVGQRDAYFDSYIHVTHVCWACFRSSSDSA